MRAGDDRPGQLVLNRARFAQTLARLADLDSSHAQELFVRLASSWGYVPGRSYITVKLTVTERRILDVLGYRRLIKPLTPTQLKESKRMAAKAAAKKGKAASKPADDIDELAAELAGLEEIDEEEPDAEVDDDEEEGEDLSTMTVAQLKAKAKEVGAKTTGNKATLIAAIEAAGEADDEEDEDDDEDEDDETEGPDFASMSRVELKAFITEHDEAFKAKKSQTDDDLREIAAAHARSDAEDEADDEEDDEDEDDGPDFAAMDRAELKAHLVSLDAGFKAKKSQTDDDLRALCAAAEEPAPAKPPAKGKTTPAKKATPAKGKQPGQLIRALPPGKLGANDIAEMAGTSALNVRNFLRSEAGQKYPKDAATGRYAFSPKTAGFIVKKMQAAGGSKAKAAAK